MTQRRTSVVVTLALACSTSHGLRQMQIHQALDGDSCEDLSTLGLSMQLNNINATEALMNLCEFWPTQWGSFPISSGFSADLMKLTFGDGGVYQKAKHLMQGRKTDGTFCWKTHFQRPTMEPTGYKCPPILSKDDWVHEKPFSVNATPDSNGNFQCLKSCTDICGGAEFRAVDSTSMNTCHCRSRSPVMVGTGGFHYIRQTVALKTQAIPTGCDMIHQSLCFSTCPSNAKPTLFSARFMPMCESRCEDPNLPFECGFGCAKDVAGCIDIWKDQAFGVIRSIAGTVGLVTGNPLMFAAVDAVVSIIAFVDIVVKKIHSVMVTALQGVKAKEQQASVLLSMLQLLLEAKVDSSKEQIDMKEGAMFLARIYGDFSEMSLHKLPSVTDIVSTLSGQGHRVIFAFYGLIRAYDWPHRGTSIASATES